MAKENYVSLRGQLRGDVKYVLDADGNPKEALFRLTVLRRDIRNRSGNFEPKIDKPIISTDDPEMIRKCQELKLEDIIEVKGFFKTKFVVKHKVCPHCGSVNSFDSKIQTIYPVYIGRCKELESNLEGMDYLRSCAEISNIVKMIGRVCTPDEDILFGETDRGDLYAKYQIAVNRKLYAADSVDEEDHADYPVVYSYNDVAEQDQALIQQGALVYIDGYLHTMNYTVDVTCHECNESFAVKMQRMNLTPYAVEYLRDYKNDGLESTHTSKEALDEPETVLPGDLD